MSVKTLEVYHRHSRKLDIAELKEMLQIAVWTKVTIEKAVQEFIKRLNACVVAKGGYFYYSQKLQCCAAFLYIRLNGVNFCVIAWTFYSTPKSL